MMPKLNGIKACVFDAYGTLFDVNSAARTAQDSLGDKWQPLAELWRTKQLQYTWLRSLARRHADFWQVTREALVYSCRSLGLPCETTQQEDLMQEYLCLKVYPDVSVGLEALRSQRLAILSNGSPQMLEAVAEHAGLKQAFAILLSVDRVKTYKPSPIVYQLAVDSLNLKKSQIGFVSSNYWDAAGAAAFGFPAFWLNRGEAAPDQLGIEPKATITGLGELAGLL